MRKRSRRSGFTLLEVLVVVAITGLLSSYLVLYSSTSREQLNVAIEASRLAQVIARAKALTISTYGASTALCGYGVHVNYAQNEFSLVSFDAPSCATLVTIPNFASSTVYKLPAEVTFSTDVTDPVTDIFFLPPDPKTILNVGGALVTNRNGSIMIRARGGSVSRTITLSPGGQITF